MNYENSRSDPDFHVEDAGSATETGFGLKDILLILHMRWRLIAVVAASVFAIVVMIVLQLTPLYAGKALVMLDQRKNSVIDADAVLSGLPSDQSTVQNQIQILQSQTLASHVVEKAHLVGDPEFDPAANGSMFEFLGALNPRNWFGGGVTVKTDLDEKTARENAIIDRLEKRLTVSPVGLSLAMVIQFESEDPVKAAQIANAFADSYVEDQLNTKFEATQKATKWMADRLQQLNGQSQQAESAVAQYKADRNLTETAQGVSLVDQQLGGLNAQLITARADLAEQQAKLSRVKSLQAAGRSADVTQVVDSPLILQLRQQETELGRQEAELASKYGPRHPKLLDLESQKANLQAKINEEVNRVIQTVSNAVFEAGAKVSSLQAGLDSFTSQSTVQNQARVKLKALESNAESTRALYDAFLSRFKAMQDQEGIQTPDSRILSRAETPKGQSFPNIPLILAAAVPLSLVLGLLAAFAVERLDNGFRTTTQVERTLGLPVLATVPEVRDAALGDAHPASLIIDKPLSAYTEAIRSLQLGLALAKVDERSQVILITSASPGEGKTTVALSLARQLARGGKKVVVVDGDLRRPTLTKSLGGDAANGGILGALFAPEDLAKFVQKEASSNLYYLGSQEAAPNPPDVLGSAAMAAVIGTLRKTFDFVVMDSAPLLPVNDTRMLVPLADAVVFVTRWEKTPREAATTAVAILRKADAPLAGVVLARTDAARYQQYNYGYSNYYQYSKYYSE